MRLDAVTKSTKSLYKPQFSYCMTNNTYIFDLSRYAAPWNKADRGRLGKAPVTRYSYHVI